jgi:hypothetical protein
VYVVLFIVGGVLSYSGQPDTDSPPAKIVAYYSQSSHRDKINLAWLLIIIGVFFFIWFLGGLRQTLSRIDPGGNLTAVATLGGAVYAALTLAGTSVNAGIKTMSDDTFHHQVYPSLIHAADDTGYALHSAGGVGIAALIIATTVATRRAGTIPGWAAVLSVIVGVAAILSIFFFPQLLIALWVLVAGILLTRPESSGLPRSVG